MSKVKKSFIFIFAIMAACGFALGGHLIYRAHFAKAENDVDCVSSADELTDCLSQGNHDIRLESDITLTDTLTISTDLTIDLNGHVLRYGGTDINSVITVVVGGDLTITDNSTAETHHYYTVQENGLYNFDGTLTCAPDGGGDITCGIITGGDALSGGGVNINGGTFTLQGGAIAGNEAGLGGGISATNQINLLGGMVVGNVALGKENSCAGGIYAASGTLVSASGDIVIEYNEAVAGGETKNSNLYLTVGTTLNIEGELDDDAVIYISEAPTTATEEDSGYSSEVSFLTGFVESNRDKEVSEYIKADYLSVQAGKTYEPVKNSSGSIVWKQYKLIKAPATRYKEIRYDGTTKYSTDFASLSGASVEDDSLTQIGTYELEIDLDDESNTRWEDGSKEPIIFTVKVLPLLVDKPVADDSVFDYNGLEQTYNIPANDYYTVQGAKHTEAGTYRVTVSLNNPNVAWNDDAESTGDLVYDFVIVAPHEVSLITLITILGIILVAECLISLVYWTCVKRYEYVHSGNYIERSADKKKNNKRNKMKISLGGVAAMLAVYVPTWEIVLVVMLTTAIILVAVYNIYLFTRHKKPVVEQTPAVQQRYDHFDTDDYKPQTYSDTAATSYTPYAPPPTLTGNYVDDGADDYEQMSIDGVSCPVFGEYENSQDDVPDLIVRPIIVFNDDTPVNEHSAYSPARKTLADNVAMLDDDAAVEDIPVGGTEAEHVQVMDDNGEVEEELCSVDYDQGIAYVTRYKRSFTARLIQSWDESKLYYSELKNYALSYRGTKSKVDWDYDCISVNAVPIISFDIRGKTLCMYLALDTEEFKDSKFKVERTQIKKYEQVPCLYRIKNPTRANNAIELIDTVCEKFGLERGRKQHKDYTLPYEEIHELVEKQLVKPYIAKEKYDDFLKKSGKS